MPKSELNTDALYAALDSKRAEKKLSWKQVANEVEVSASTLTRMAQGKRPDADGLTSLLGWLNLDLKHFVKNLDEPNDKSQNTVALISALLRSDASLTSDSAKALENVLRASYETLRKREE